MRPYFITFRSVTYAQRGERILKNAGIDCHLRRTPRWMESKGCGYALELEEPRQAAAVLRENQLTWQKIYRILGKDRAEVVEL